MARPRPIARLPLAALLAAATALGAAAPGTAAPSRAEAVSRAGVDVPDGPEGAPTPEAAVRGLFDAMRAADSAAARRLLHPEARLHRPVRREGERALRVTSPGGWLEGIGGAEPGRLDERIWDLEVRIDGDLATAWMRYAFYLDGELHHCGVNAFQLVRTGEGWKAFAIADTSRREGCDPPAGVVPDGG